jgi:hypothetical protein
VGASVEARMRKLTLLALCCFCFVGSPATAASLFNGFSLSGFVLPAIETSPVPVSQMPTPWFIGQPIGEQFVFDVTDLGTTGFGALATNVPSTGFIVPASPRSLVSLSNTGTTFSGVSINSSPPPSTRNFSGSVGTSGFTYHHGSQSSDILAARRPIILSASPADDPPTANLSLKVVSSSVSPVPLPPAGPLFALALAALGIAAFRRWKSARMPALS